MEQTIIMVGHGKAQEIAKVFNVTKAMVSMSLRNKRKGDLAKKIRHVALTQYDGIEMQPVGKSQDSGSELN